MERVHAHPYGAARNSAEHYVAMSRARSVFSLIRRASIRTPDSISGSCFIDNFIFNIKLI